MADTAGKIAAMAGDYATLRDENSDLAERVVHLKKRIETLRERSVARNRRYRAKLAEARQQIAELRCENQRVLIRAATAETLGLSAFQQLGSELVVAQQQIALLESELAEARKIIKGLDMWIAVFSDDFVAMRGD